MIDIRKLKELVRLMVDNDLIELDLRDSEEQVTVRRPNPFGGAGGAAGGVPQMMMQSVPQMMQAAAGQPIPASVGNGARAATAASGIAPATPPESETEAGLVKIASPMVGTFYATPNPDSAPFASVGTTVSPDKVVCIIEAMKIFNEIKAEVSGVIQKVLVKNGDPVEFGQPLFLVKPA